MNGIAANRVEICGQGSHQGFALPGAHLRNFSVVEYHPTDQLHIEVTHLQRAPGCLPDYCKRFDQKLLDSFALSRALAEFPGFCLEFLIGQRLKRWLEGINLVRLSTHLAQKALIAAAENFRRYLAEHRIDLPKVVKWVPRRPRSAARCRKRAVALQALVSKRENTPPKR